MAATPSRPHRALPLGLPKCLSFDSPSPSPALYPKMDCWHSRRVRAGVHMSRATPSSRNSAAALSPRVPDGPATPLALPLPRPVWTTSDAFPGNCVSFPRPPRPKDREMRRQGRGKAERMEVERSLESCREGGGCPSGVRGLASVPPRVCVRGQLPRGTSCRIGRSPPARRLITGSGAACVSVFVGSPGNRQRVMKAESVAAPRACAWTLQHAALRTGMTFRSQKQTRLKGTLLRFITNRVICPCLGESRRGNAGFSEACGR